MRRASFAVLAVSAATLIALRFNPVYDPDSFWHLATARWIAAHRAIPTVDAFSHTARGRPLLFVDALADGILYGAWSLGGYAAMALTTGVLGALAVSISLRHKRIDASLLTAAPLIAAVIFRVTPRPQTFALPCFAALLATLDAARARPRWLYAAPALVALWQNLHPSAPLGVAAVGAFALAETLRTRDARALRWWAALAGSCLALLCTHRPLDRLAAGLGHVSDVNMAELITEWSPLLRRDGATPYAYGFYALLALSLAGLGASWRARSPRVEHALLGALAAAQAFHAVRFVPFAALALAPLALEGASALLGPLRGSLRVALAALAAAVLGALIVLPQGHGWGAGVNASLFPVGAARFLEAQRVAGRALNEFTFGGYLIWTLTPRLPVFIDGRSMALYDPRFVDSALRAQPPALQGFLSRYDIGVIVHRTSSLLTWAESLPGWSVVYFDDTAFVAVRDADHLALARAHGYRALHAGDWAGVVRSLREDPSGLPTARVELARALRAAPNASIVRVLEGAVELGAGDHAAAERAFSQALRVRRESVPARRGLLMVCEMSGDRACVCDRSRRVLARAPRNRYAREAARRAGCPVLSSE